MESLKKRSARSGDTAPIGKYTTKMAPHKLTAHQIMTLKSLKRLPSLQIATPSSTATKKPLLAESITKLWGMDDANQSTSVIH